MQLAGPIVHSDKLVTTSLRVKQCGEDAAKPGSQKISLTVGDRAL